MHNKPIAIFALLTIFSLSIIGCQTQTGNNGDSKFSIVTTTGMIRDAVVNITGDSAKVTSLMGPGVDPHLYKATQGDLRQLRKADMVFYNGLHLEGKMTEIFEKFSRQKPVIPVADGVKKDSLIETKAFSGTYDPHIWFDIELWKKAVRHTAKKIKQFDSSNASYYQANHGRFQEKLTALDTWISGRLTKIPEAQRVLITAHDAFGYFGRAYNIRVKGLQGISTTSEYGLQDVNKLVDFIVGNNIKAVFVESSVPTKNLEAVVQGCKEKGHEVEIGGTLYSDAMGKRGSPEGTYIGMVKHNVNTILAHLK